MRAAGNRETKEAWIFAPAANPIDGVEIGSTTQYSNFPIEPRKEVRDVLLYFDHLHTASSGRAASFRAARVS